MHRQIWKFELDSDGEIQMPAGANILTVQTQNDKPMIWAIVDPQAPMETKKFTVLGTGWFVPPSTGVYIGTFQLQGGALVFHVFHDMAGQGEVDQVKGD